MARQKEVPPLDSRGTTVRALPRANQTTSEIRVTCPGPFDKPPTTYNGYHVLCLFRGEWIFEPPSDKPNRVLCALRNGALIALTPLELSALDDDMRDKLMTSRLFAEGERIRINNQAAADRAEDAADAQAKALASESFEMARVRHSLSTIEHAMGVGGEA